MKKRKINKEALKKKEILDNKRFNKTILISFMILSLLIFTVLIFYTYRCSTLFYYRTRVLYGKEISSDLVCFNENKLKHHKTIPFKYNHNNFYVCSNNCKLSLTINYNKVAMALDAFSGDTILKSRAIIGLKKKKNPTIVYFKNKVNFNRYYRKQNKK